MLPGGQQVSGQFARFGVCVGDWGWSKLLVPLCLDLGTDASSEDTTLVATCVPQMGRGGSLLSVVRHPLRIDNARLSDWSCLIRRDSSVLVIRPFYV